MKIPIDKFKQQISLPHIGIKGQGSIQNSKILVIGCGGLGCPLLQYLVASGIENITIIDNDKIELSNLPRQILFHETDMGQYKTDIAKQRLETFNPNANIIAIPQRMDSHIARQYVHKHDIIVDCTDSFLTKYVLSDICIESQRPLIIGAVTRMRGYVGCFDENTPYQMIFPAPSTQSENCVQSGVLGPVAGLIGNLMAIEILNIITMKDKKLNFLCDYDAENHKFNKIDFSNIANIQSAEKKLALPPIYNIDRLGEDHDLIDIRQKHELSVVPKLARATHICFEEIKKDLSVLRPFKNPVFMCHSGRRAESAALLYALFLQKNNLGIKGISIFNKGGDPH